MQQSSGWQPVALSWHGAEQMCWELKQETSRERQRQSCYLLPPLLRLPAAAQESLPLSGMLLLWPMPWGPSPWHSASLLEPLRLEKLPFPVEQPWLLQNLGDLPCWASEEIFITVTLNLVRFFIPEQMSVDFCYVFLPEIFSDKSSKHLMETEPSQENAVLNEACLLGKYFECQILPNSEKVSFLPFFDKECS